MLACQIDRSLKMATFQERFIKLKNENNLSVLEIAESIGMTQPNLTKIINGNVKLRVETVEKLALFFNVDPSYLLGESNIRIEKDKLPPDYVEVSEKAYREGITAETMNDMVEFYLKNRHK